MKVQALSSELRRSIALRPSKFSSVYKESRVRSHPTSGMETTEDEYPIESRTSTMGNEVQRASTSSMDIGL